MDKAKKIPTVDIKKILKITASIKLTVVCLLILTLLVVWGTVYQAEHGLYQAQQKFFHSWVILLFDFIPFPGTVLILFVLFFNLVSSLFFRIGFRLSNLGNIITHTGILVLLVGGFFTFYFSEESTLMLREGETSTMSTSRHLWELAVAERGGENIFAVDTLGLHSGETINFPELTLQLRVKEYYDNCAVNTSESSGMQELQARPKASEASQNIAGMVFEIGPPAGVKRTVLLYGENSHSTMAAMANRTYLFSLGRKKMPLHLALTLLDFKVKFYPNSNIPKSYESRVKIKAAGGIEREVVISMNKPLRFKNLTFFQSSYFIGRDGSEHTVLAVVKNVGRLLPYIASIWIFLGLLVHFLVKLIKRSRRRGEPASGGR
jgi:cytochrome c biogenesis protein ResB